MQTLNVQTRTRISGRLFLLASLLMLIAAWNTGANLYYIIFGGLVSFSVLSYPFSRCAMQGLKVRREAPAAVHRGARFPVIVRISGDKRFLPAIAIKVARVGQNGEADRLILTLPPKHTAVFQVMEQFDRRGVHPLPSLELSSAFPFGLVERTEVVADHVEVVVYPRVTAIRPTSLEQRLAGGSSLVKAYGEGDEFFSLREYVPGDDLRKVAWRPSAKRHMLLVKELDQETSRHIACVFDNRIRTDVEGFEERFEEAVELFASVAVTLLNRHFTVSLMTSDAFLPQGEGPSHAIRVLDILARVVPTSPEASDPYQRVQHEFDERRVRFICVSPDPSMWGHTVAGSGVRYLHPSEVVYA